MKRHQRIERLLRIREKQEEAARAAWAAAQRRAQECEREAQQGVANWRAGQDRLRAGLAHLSPEQILWNHAAVDGQWARAQELRSVARRVQTAAEQKRGPWIQARQTVRAMERLHERLDRTVRRERSEREAQAQSEAIEAHLARRAEQEALETEQPTHLSRHE